MGQAIRPKESIKRRTTPCYHNHLSIIYLTLREAIHGYELDTYFIEKAHHTSPRRLYSHTGADWQHRVDFERMRKERLQRTRDQLEAFDLGALVLYAGANIRYVTGSYQGNWKYNINIRYVVLPRAVSRCSSRPPVRTCTVPASICPGCRVASDRP